jgi:hypothetical protein
MGTYIPMGDPACRDCQGHKSTVAAHRDYIERTGESIDLREFVKSGLIAPNSFIGTARLHEVTKYW